MPYNTEYNRNVAKQVADNDRRYLKHIELNRMEPYLDYDSNFKGSGFDEDDKEYKIIEKAKKQEGSGIVDIIQTIPKRAVSTLKSAKRLIKKEGNLSSTLKDIANVVSLGKLHKMKGMGNDALMPPPLMTPQERLNQIVKDGGAKKPAPKKSKMEGEGVSGGKKRGRPKKLKMEGEGVSGGSKEIDNIMSSVGGVKKYTGKGKSDRVVGGRKLLLKEEQPPSQMSGFGKAKKPNKWLTFLSEFRNKHPELKGKFLVMEAKKHYK